MEKFRPHVLGIREWEESLASLKVRSRNVRGQIVYSTHDPETENVVPFEFSYNQQENLGRKGQQSLWATSDSRFSVSFMRLGIEAC